MNGNIARAALAAMSLTAAPAMADSVRWAGLVTPGSGNDASVNILHAPDLRMVGVGAARTVSSFGAIHNHSDFTALGIARADLDRAQIVAFEGNGGAGAGVDKGFESSRWTFSDGAKTLVVIHNEGVAVSSGGADKHIIRTGQINVAAYRNAFNLCCSQSGLEVMGYILFDLSAAEINVSNPGFTVKVESMPGVGEGTPDPDAIGVLAKCEAKMACPIFGPR